MAAGPNEQRLRTYIDPARTWQVFVAKEKWGEGARALKDVAEAVQKARPLARENLGNHTAEAADTAFVAMHDKVLARQQQMKDGETALADAIDAITRAETVRDGFDAEGPLNEPTPPEWDEDEVRQIQQMKIHSSQVSLHNSQVAAREEAAAAAIQDLDSTNKSSTETMRKIQGERPDVPSGGGDGGDGGGGGDGGTPTGGGGRRTPTSPPRVPDPPTDLPTNPPTNGETGTPLSPGTGTTPAGAPGTVTSPGVTSGAGNIGGLAGAIGGGLAGGAVGMGGVMRGGLGAAAPTDATTRAIGSSGRSGSSGALGREGAAGSTAGRATAARGAGGRAAGAGTGGRGKAGSPAAGRGAGRRVAGGAGGRGGRKNQDDEQPQIDAIIDDQDWVDDEDASPGVIS